MSAVLIPVRIEFELRTPMIIPSTGKHLDALLSWAAVQEADFHGHENPIAVQHDIGLARHEVGDQWCFMSSLLDITWQGEPLRVHYIKRSKLDDYVNAWDDGLFKKAPGFDSQRRATKAGSFLQPVRWVKKVVGYAMVHDLDRVQRLLPWVTHIGKLAHKDYGAVNRFELQEDPVAEQAWTHRFLPMDSPLRRPNHAPAIGALAAPYWKRENFVELAIPCPA